MNSQSLTLVALGVFVSLIVAVAAIDHYLFEEHPPSEVGGLLWRVTNAISRVKDLEAVVEVTEASQITVRMRVRLVNQPLPALSVRYLDPPELEGQIFTVENDLLSHVLPNEGIIVVKRWVGVPLASVGLAALDLSQIETAWKAGKLRLQVLQSVPAFSANAFPTPVDLSGTLTESFSALPLSFCPEISQSEESYLSLSKPAEGSATGTLRGEYLLEVRDAPSGKLTRMVWIDQETYFVHKVVFYSQDGQREKTIELQQLTIDQGLTADEILLLPRGLETLRG
jgi:hypothetical protein